MRRSSIRRSARPCEDDRAGRDGFIEGVADLLDIRRGARCRRDGCKRWNICVARVRDVVRGRGTVRRGVGDLEGDDLRDSVVRSTRDTSRDEIRISECKRSGTIRTCRDTRGGAIDDDLDGCIRFDRTRDIHGRVRGGIDRDG